MWQEARCQLNNCSTASALQSDPGVFTGQHAPVPDLLLLSLSLYLSLSVSPSLFLQLFQPAAAHDHACTRSHNT